MPKLAQHLEELVCKTYYQVYCETYGKDSAATALDTHPGNY